MPDRERGYTYCERRGKPVKGSSATGDSHSVKFPVRCPPGSKARALMHTHPSGSIRPSRQDLRASSQHGRAVCVGSRLAGRMIIKCYRPKTGK